MADVMPITARARSHAHPSAFSRAEIEDAIEHLLGVLDALDGDADFEPLSDDEPNGDFEPANDDEWAEPGVNPFDDSFVAGGGSGI